MLVTVNHNLDNPDHGVFEINQGTILPKMIEINLDFTVIHEHSLGWAGDTFSEQSFPYNAVEAFGNTTFGQDDLDALAAQPAPPSESVEDSELNDSQADAQNGTPVSETPDEQGDGSGEGVPLLDALATAEPINLGSAFPEDFNPASSVAVDYGSTERFRNVILEPSGPALSVRTPSRFEFDRITLPPIDLVNGGNSNGQ